jgi:putative FmdB family regulatory protein
MPMYEYLCHSCGPFEEIRPIGEFAEPTDCPDCGTAAPRVMLTAPRLALMSSGDRHAHATNERSRHEPHFSTRDSRAAGGHGPGCSCCSSSKSAKNSRTAVGKDGSKAFPSARPWMISH